MYRYGGLQQADQKGCLKICVSMRDAYWAPLLGSVEQAAYKWAFKHGPLHQANPAETSQHLCTRERITLALLLLRYPPPSGDPQTGQWLNCTF